MDSSLTRGMVYLRVGWGRAPDSSLLCPPPLEWRPPRPARAAALPGPEGDLEDWCLTHRLDPADPGNASVLGELEAARRSLGAGEAGEEQRPAHSTAFRLDQLEDQFAFCSESELESSLRFHMLRLRRAKAPQFRNYTMLPALEKEIPRGILEAHARWGVTRTITLHSRQYYQ